MNQPLERVVDSSDWFLVHHFSDRIILVFSWIAISTGVKNLLILNVIYKASAGATR